jgi:hypothetical protein
MLLDILLPGQKKVMRGLREYLIAAGRNEARRKLSKDLEYLHGMLILIQCKNIIEKYMIFYKMG